MRQLNRFVTRFGHHERNFTEAQIVKFTKPRDPDGTNPATAELSFFTNTTLTEVVTSGEPVRQCSLAKGFSA
jgi:hypothetical protein